MLSELAFGEKYGCFEKPSEKEPTKNVDCPEVLPLKYSEEPPFENAMVNDSPLVHPDSRSLTKYWNTSLDEESKEIPQATDVQIS